MYNLIEKKSSISKIDCDNKCENIYYSSENILFKNDMAICNNVEPTTFYLTPRDNIFYYDKNGKSYFLKDNKQQKICERVFHNTFQELYVVGKTNWRREKRKFYWELGVYNFVEDVYISKTNYQNYISLGIIDDNYLFHKSGKKLILLSSNNLETIWKVELETFMSDFKLGKYFGCIDNKLIFSDDKHTVFVLHKETGEIINTFSELPGINPKSQDKFKGRIMDSQNFVLDKESQLLLGAYGANYIEIDLKDNTCRFKQLSEIMEDHNILTFLAMRDNPFTNEHLFLTTINKGVGKQKDERFNSIVALNRKTLKIDWEHIFVDEGLGPNIPVICNDLLLQKTLENNLYIFQKDKTNI